MKIKMKIIKWLGINEFAESKANQAVSNNLPSDKQLRKMVGEAVRDSFSGMSDTEYLSAWHIPSPYNTFKEALRNEVQRSKIEEYQTFINTEEFVDKTVERIKNKQIN